MYENKLFPLLSKLSRRELGAFGKYLTRHFTRQDIPTKVFLYVREFYPAFSKADLNPEAIHEQLFSQEPFNRMKVLNAYSDIYQQLRDFLLIEHVRKGPFDARYAWISILKERGLEQAARQEATYLRTDVEALPKKDTTDYLKSIEAYYYFTYLTDLDRRKPDLEALQGYVQNLDIYYAICRLKAACEILNINRQSGKSMSLAILPGVLDMIADAPETQDPLLLCYRAVYQLLYTGEEQYFARAEALLSEYIDHISTADLHIIVSYLHNYATPKIREGEKSILWKIHRINCLSLDYNVFSMPGSMSSSQFNNIVYMACTLKEFKWAERFILKQRNYLDEDIRDVTVELAKATFYFEQKQFDQALICLQSAPFREEHHVLRASLLTIMAYYEITPEHPLLDNACNNAEQYFYRLKNSLPAPADAALKFVRIVRLLLKSQKSRSAILEIINQPGQLASRDWLLEKTGQYKPKYIGHSR